MTPTNEEIDPSLFPDASAMKDADDIWKGGEEEAAKRNPVGSFLWEIEDAELTRSTSSDKLQIHYHLKVLSPPENIGVEVDKYDGLGSPKQASITQQQLKRIGVDTSKVTMKTLPAILLELKGKKVLGTAKQNGDFYNMYFSKLAPDGTNALAAAASGNGAKGGRPAPAKGGKAGRKF